MSSDAYSYCFVRQDLPGPYQTVQAGHAWMQVTLDAVDQLCAAPLRGVNFVLLGVADEDALISVAKEVAKMPWIYHLFYETDGDFGYTALATGALVGEQRAWFQRFPKLEASTAL